MDDWFKETFLSVAGSGSPTCPGGRMLVPLHVNEPSVTIGMESFRSGDWEVKAMAAHLEYLFTAAEHCCLQASGITPVPQGVFTGLGYYNCSLGYVYRPRVIQLYLRVCLQASGIIAVPQGVSIGLGYHSCTSGCVYRPPVSHLHLRVCL